MEYTIDDIEIVDIEKKAEEIYQTKLNEIKDNIEALQELLVNSGEKKILSVKYYQSELKFWVEKRNKLLNLTPHQRNLISKLPKNIIISM